MPGDAELIAEVRAGSGTAYDVVVGRHRHAARALATALAGAERADQLVDLALQAVLARLLAGGGPVVAMRPYLLAAVVGTHGSPLFTAPHDAAEIWRDGSELGAALADLEETHRLVLWHLEVEGESPLQVGPLLDMPTSAVPDLESQARVTLHDVAPFVSAVDLGRVLLGEDAERYVAGVRRQVPRAGRRTGAAAQGVRTAAAVAAVVLVGVGAVTTAVAGVPDRSDDRTDATTVTPTVPIIAAPSRAAGSTRSPAPEQTGPVASPGATGSVSPTATPHAKHTTPGAPSFGLGDLPPTTTKGSSASADVAIAARANDDAVTWAVSGLPDGASTVVTITAPSGTTLQPAGDDCTGGGTDPITCTATAGEPGGTLTVADPTPGTEAPVVSLSVQPVSGLADPEPGNNDATVTP